MPLAVVVVAGAHINAAAASLDDAIYRLLVFRAHLPVLGEVVADAVRDDADGNRLLLLGIGQHDAVDGIVQCSVASHHHDGTVAVVGQDACQTFHRSEAFGLHVVVVYALAVHVGFYLLPSFLYFSGTGFGVVDDSPLFGCYAHDDAGFTCYLKILSSLIGAEAVQLAPFGWMLQTY